MSNGLKAPTNLVASAITANTITLTWSAVSGDVVFYDIYKRDAVIRPPYISGLKLPSATLMDLLPDTSYVLQVAAHTGDGDASAMSEPITVKTAALVIDLKISTTTNDSFTLSWTSIPNAVYRMYINGRIPDASVLRETSAQFYYSSLSQGGQTSFQISAILPGSLLIGKESGKSNILLVSAPLAAPTYLAASAMTSSSLTLTWVGVVGVTGYKIYKNGVFYSNSTKYSISAQVTGLSPATQYSFQVSAVKDAIESAKSNNASATTTLDAPQNLATSAITANSLKLTWATVLGAINYKIYKDGISHSTSTTAFAQIVGLSPETEYSFQVSAANGAIESAKSNNVLATTTLEIVPEIAIALPAVNTVFTTNAVISGTCTNAQLVRIYAYIPNAPKPYDQVDCTIISNPSTGIDTWTGILPKEVTKLQEGDLMILAVAWRNADATGKQSRNCWQSYKVSATPTIAIVAPVAESVFSNNAVISGTCTSAKLVRMYAYVPNTQEPYDQVDCIITPNPSTGIDTWVGTLPKNTELKDGNLSILVVAWNNADATGKQSSNCWRNYKVEITPVVGILLPAADTSFSNKAVVNGTCTNAKLVRMYAYVPNALEPYDQVDCTITSNPLTGIDTWIGTLPKNIAKLKEGDLSILVVAWRNADATGRQSPNCWRNYKVDVIPDIDTAPHVDITSPEANSTFETNAIINGTCVNAQLVRMYAYVPNAEEPYDQVDCVITPDPLGVIDTWMGVLPNHKRRLKAGNLLILVIAWNNIDGTGLQSPNYWRSYKVADPLSGNIRDTVDNPLLPYPDSTFSTTTTPLFTVSIVPPDKAQVYGDTNVTVYFSHVMQPVDVTENITVLPAITPIDIDEYANLDTTTLLNNPNYPVGEQFFLGIPFSIPSSNAGNVNPYRLVTKSDDIPSLVKTPVNISSHFNANSVAFPDNPLYPIDTTDAPIVLLGVPFSIPSMTDAYNTWLAGDSSTSLDITGLTIANATTVYLLMNTKGTSADPDKTVSVVFTGSGGATFTKTLRENEDIRNYNSLASYPTPNTNINGTTTRNVWIRAWDQRLVLDMVEITLPSDFSTQTLTGITITDNTNLQRVFVKGITIVAGDEAGGNPDDDGDNPDDDNGSGGRYNAWAASGTGAVVLSIPVEFRAAHTVYFLMNTLWGNLDPLGLVRITFKATGDISFTKSLISNKDIRDYNLGMTTTINNVNTQNIWSNNSQVLDMVKIELPSIFSKRTLTSIEINDDGAQGLQRVFIKGITVATGSNSVSDHGLIYVDPDPGGTWTWAQDHKSIVYEHNDRFEFGNVTVVVDNGLKDIDDIIAPTATATFAVIDKQYPMILSTEPTDTAIEVAVNTYIKIVFSKSMDFSTIIPNTNIVLRNQITNSPITLLGTKVDLNNDGKVLVLRPTNKLSESTSYEIVITNTSIYDLSGNPLLIYPISVFTTVIKPPLVVDFSPPDKAQAYNDTAVTVSFSRPMKTVDVTKNITVPSAITALDISSYANIDTMSFTHAPIYPTGEQIFLDIPFNIPSVNGYNAWFADGEDAISLPITVRFRAAHTVYFLMNTAWGSTNLTGLASITFEGTNNTSFTKVLIGNSDIRNYSVDEEYTTVINDTTTKKVWTNSQQVLDMIKIELPPVFLTETLTRITINDNGATSTQRLFLKGITVAVGNEAGSTQGLIYIDPDVGGAWTWAQDKKSISYAHITPFALGDVTTFVTSAIEDQYGESAPNISATFTVVDKQYPMIVGIEPANKAVAVSIETNLKITFSREMQFSTIVPNGNIILRDKTTGVIFPLSIEKIDFNGDGKTLVLKPLSKLIEDASYEIVVVNTNILDISGKALLAYPVISFTTQTSAPFTVNVIPTENAQVFGDTKVTVYFSHKMRTVSVANLIYVSPDVGGTWTWAQDQQNIVYNHTTPFNSGNVKVFIKDGVKDQNGNNAPVATVTFIVVDRTRPMVVSIAPTNQATQVALNTNITIKFSKSMKISTIIPNNNVILCNQNTGAIIALSNEELTDVNGDGKTIALKPLNALFAGITYEILINNNTILDTSDNVLLPYPISVFSTTPQIPLTVNITPPNEAQVFGDTSVTVTFSRPMQTVDAANLIYVNPSPGGSWAWSQDKKSITYTHVLLFNPGDVRVIVNPGLKDIDGNSAPAASATFIVIDKKNPTIIAMVPIDKAVEVAINTTVKIVFSKAMNFNSIIPNSNIILRNKNTGNAVPFADNKTDLNHDGKTLVLTLSEPLLEGVVYEIVVNNANILDLANNTLLAYPISSFTTVALAPFIVSIAPPDKALAYPDTKITVFFSRKMLTENTAGLITLEPDPIGVWAWAQDQKSIVYTHEEQFSPGNVTVTVNSGFKDQNGNNAPTASSVFTVIDKIKPTVVSIEPINQSIQIPIDTTIQIVFSKPMNFSTIIPNTNIVLRDKSTHALTTLSNEKIDLDNDQKTLVLKPNSPLIKGTRYEIAITNSSIFDTSKNALLAYPNSTFTTVVPAASVYATITPKDGETSVSLQASIVVVFSRKMQIAAPANLIDISPSIEGTWTWSQDQIITFRHTIPFTPGYVNVAVKNGFQDIDGNKVPPVQATFLAIDTSNPKIVAMEPANQAVQIPINTAIRIDFSKPMDFFTIVPNTNIIVRDRVTGAVMPLSNTKIDLNNNKITLILKLVEPLAEATRYEIVVTNSTILDAAKIPLLSYPISTFTTKLPDVVVNATITPKNGETRVPWLASIVVIFSRKMQTLVPNYLIDIVPGMDGNWTWSQEQILTFKHTVPFMPGDVTVTVKSGFQDKDGNKVPVVASTFTAFDPTNPAIIEIEPANQAVQIPINTTLKIVFSRPMNFSTIIPNTNIVLRSKSNRVIMPLSNEVINLNNDTKTLILKPKALLAEGTRYEIVIVNSSIFDTTQNSLLVYSSPNFMTAVPTDVANATITPKDGETSVSSRVPVVIVFSHKMQIVTPMPLIDINPDPGGIWTWSQDQILTFQHTDPFTLGDVTVTVKNGFKDKDGNNIPSVTATFATIDTINPVATIEPVDQATQIPVDTTIKAVFSKPMDFSTIVPNTNIILRDRVTHVMMLLSDIKTDLNNDKITLVLNPINQLIEGTRYEITIVNATILDMAKNPLLVYPASSFTTKVPAILVNTTITPKNGETKVPLQTSIIVVFSHKMQTVTPNNLIDITPSLDGVWTWSQDQILTFQHTIPLTPGTVTVTVKPGFQDKDGNNALSTTSVFTAVDTTNPSIVEMEPIDQDVQIPVTTTLKIVFSKPMDFPTIVPNTNIVLREKVTRSLVALSSEMTNLNNDQKTLILKPSNSLIEGTRYEVVVINKTIFDISKNPLLVYPNSAFTTTVAINTVNATITPKDGETRVPLLTSIVIIFSRKMQIITPTNLVDISPNPGGTWTWSQDQIITFKHTAPFKAGKVTVAVKSGFQDQNGNNVPPVKATFTAVDTTNPTITEIEPANRAIQISLTTDIQIKFSKAMQFSSLSPNTNIILRNKSDRSIVYMSSKIGDLNSDSKIAILKPLNPLKELAAYEIVINSSNIYDVDGNVLASYPVSAFTTKALDPQILSYDVLLTPGLNGLSIPLNPTLNGAVKYTNKTLAELIERNLGTGTLQAMRWYDTSMKKWVTAIPGTEMKTFEWYEGVFIQVSITRPQILTFRGYVINNGNITIPLKQGLNLIGIPLKVNGYGYDSTRDMFVDFTTQISEQKLVSYIARKAQDLDLSKKLLGYTYVEGELHPGFSFVTDKLGGDAIAIVSPKVTSIKITGTAWND